MNDENMARLIRAEFEALADRLVASPPDVWDAASLCEGWRTREVVAHVTMAARYSNDEFMAELRDCGLDFTVLSDKVATRDGQLPLQTLLDDLRSPTLHAWRPPGGGDLGALSHVVIHGIDIAALVDADPKVSDESLVIVLDSLASGGHSHFGIDAAGRRFEADNLDWSQGSGDPLRGRAADLVAALSGRTVPPQRLTGNPLARSSNAETRRPA